MNFRAYLARTASTRLLLLGVLGLTMGGARAVVPFSNLQPSLAVNFTVIDTGPGVGNYGAVAMYAGALGTDLIDNQTEANGATLSISSNQILFAQLGTAFGGNGTTNFKLPNLTDTIPVDPQTGTGLAPQSVGGTAGTANVTLATANLPVSQGGTAQAFTNVQPSLGLSYQIATTGIYPDRAGSSESINNADGSIDHPFIGQVILTAGFQTPSGFVPANGAAVGITSNPNLFSLIGITYGGNGRSYFNLPDLQGRTVMGDGGTSPIGQAQGSETNTLTLANLPAPRGSNQPFSNLQPSLTLDYLICTGGAYPSGISSGDLGSEEVFTGQIITVAFDFAPSGWLPCDGQILNVSDYFSLYEVIGDTYGGNGTTTFALPDFRDRIAVGPSATNPIGTASGESSVTLLSNQVPPSVPVPEPGVPVLMGLGFLAWIVVRRQARRAN